MKRTDFRSIKNGKAKMLSALSLSRKWKTEPSFDSVHKFPRSINKAIKQLYIHCNFPLF